MYGPDGKPINLLDAEAVEKVYLSIKNFGMGKSIPIKVWRVLRELEMAAMRLNIVLLEERIGNSDDNIRSLFDQMEQIQRERNEIVNKIASSKPSQ